MAKDATCKTPKLVGKKSCDICKSRTTCLTELKQKNRIKFCFGATLSSSSWVHKGWVLQPTRLFPSAVPWYSPYFNCGWGVSPLLSDFFVLVSQRTFTISPLTPTPTHKRTKKGRNPEKTCTKKHHQGRQRHQYTERSIDIKIGEKRERYSRRRSTHRWQPTDNVQYRLRLNRHCVLVNMSPSFTLQ